MPPSLRRRYLRLTLLNVAANVTVPLAGLVDTAVLGHLDDIRHLAGVALAAVLFDYVYWTFGFLRMGTTGSTAQAVGAGDEEEVYLILYRAVGVAVAVGTALLVLQVPIREAGFALLAGAEGVEASGRAYFDARIWGAPAALVNFALIGWLLGRENSRAVLVMTVVANATNVVLDWLLVVVAGMAAAGAGLATMASQYAALGVGAVIFVRLGRPRPWRWDGVLDRHHLGRLMVLNRDILVRTLCLISTFALFTNFSSVLGTTVLAANAILLRILNLASYLVDGAAFATESLAGIFHGSGDRASLRRLERMSLAFGVACAVAFVAAVLASPRLLLGVLTDHAEVVARAASLGVWLAPVLLFGSVAYIYDGLFLGLTRGRVLRNSMAFSTLVVFLPVALVAVELGSNGVLWGGLAAFMAARATTLAYAARVGEVVSAA